MSTELSASSPEPAPARRAGFAALSADLLVVLGGALLVWRAGVVGQRLLDRGVNIYLDFPPLFASWAPHTGPGTIPAVAVALAVVLGGPVLARRMRWGPLLGITYLASLAWTASLTLVDGWKHGVLTKLAGNKNYLAEIDRVESIPGLLATFTDRILLEPGSWAVHVAGHPPGALVVFVWMERIGLGGFVAGAVLCVLAGATVGIGIATTLRALGEEGTARKILPFTVLMPGAVWVGVSADGLFAGVLTCGVALLAVGSTKRGWRGAPAALAGGLLLGFMLFLSYGLVLAGLLPLVVLVLTRRVRPALVAVVAVVGVVVTFAAHGFWWYEGYQLVHERYYQGIAATRPYGYFAWANLACLVLAVGPAVLAGLRRLAFAPRRMALGARLLTVSTLLCLLAADLSGMSKAEVERIWLPYSLWLVLPCALLPRRHVKWWLAAQAILALLINHLLRTRW
ncbi:hypothetical protein FHX42_003371 [Saccharopolyspora lacisalsi]|uniref:Integral membrane protein n=1 Tax=Halosaccharopolyspora lacisalsi TaxID=1000566 RepID=A0A839E2N3_9PSEU|nr:hypothetical protein [Halosaccharopolyspora lacisalsi]MBA8826005.1 hypothetical protein [Halosaccharopolyspora lacisalsi]